MAVLPKIVEYIRREKMIAHGDCVLAGVSGGADSVCLLILLSRLREMFDFDLEVLHVEHGIRGEESREDAVFVENLCERQGIRCTVRSVDVPGYAADTHRGLEEAARILRYQAFAARARELRGECKGRIRIALAHHMEDNAETVLFQILRGSGLAGVCGMQPVREKDGDVYIRPLLCVHRREIEEFLDSVGQTYRRDSTNSDVSYARNRLRLCVFPELTQINPRAVEHIHETAGRLAGVRDYLREQSEQAAKRVIEEADGSVILHIEEYTMLHRALRPQVLALAICRAARRRKDIAAVHIEALSALTEGQSGRQLSLPYGVVARREFDRVILSEKGTEEPKVQRQESFILSREQLEGLRLSSGAHSVVLPDGSRITFRIVKFTGDFTKIEKKRYTKWLDYDMIEDKVEIRRRCPGDFFEIEGGHRKRLKQYLIDEKIPLSERNRMWILAENSRILWLVGGRIGENYKVTKRTASVLVIHWDPADAKEERDGTHQKA